MTKPTALHVDDRWSGSHGIGRYATEVRARLRTEMTPLGLTGSPSDPFDAWMNRGAAVPNAVYSPGYNAFLGGGRQFVTVHDLIHLRAPWPRRLKYEAYYNGVLRPVVRRAGMVFTDSEASVAAIRRWLRDDSVTIVNAGAGCSAVFTPEGPAQSYERPTFLAVGNARPHKNLPTFLRALARTPYGASVVVPPSDATVFEALAAELGIGDRVAVKTGVSDEELAAMYRGAVATVFPSLMEGFGLPALESLRTQTPVVYWRGCESVTEIVGASGVGVEASHDIVEWAKALEAAAAGVAVDPASAGVYTWDATARTIDDALRTALDV